MVASLARLGLMVHVTAHRIDPGWSGCIVLEFYNSGKLPLALRPGMLIGALSFEPLSARRRGLITAVRMPNIAISRALLPAGLIKTEPFGAILLPIEGSMRRFLTTLMILRSCWWPDSALVLLVNPNDFRAYMVQQVAARSEYQLQLTGRCAGTYGRNSVSFPGE